MTTDTYRHTTEEMPATVDARTCVETLMHYPDWQLRRSGQQGRILSARRRLDTAVRAGDVDAICQCRLDLRQSLNIVQNMFGVRLVSEDIEPLISKGGGGTVKLW